MSHHHLTWNGLVEEALQKVEVSHVLQSVFVIAVSLLELHKAVCLKSVIHVNRELSFRSKNLEQIVETLSLVMALRVPLIHGLPGFGLALQNAWSVVLHTLREELNRVNWLLQSVKNPDWLV